MKKASIEAIVRALNDAGARYLIVGGLAVIAHGYVRATQDVDLVLHLDPDNARRALRALSDLGYRPQVPEPIERFADPEARAGWIRDRSMIVFKVWADAHRETPIDILVEEPFPFERAYAARLPQELAPGLVAPIVGYDDLVALKRRAGRPQDLADLAELALVRGEDEDDDA